MDKYNEVMFEWSAFYQRFEELCEDSNVTPQKVSEQTGISLAAMSLWRKAWYGDENEEWCTDSDTAEKGTYPNVDSLIKLALYFDVSVDYLIGIRKSYLIEAINRKNKQLSHENLMKVAEYVDLLIMKQLDEEKSR